MRYLILLTLGLAMVACSDIPSQKVETPAEYPELDTFLHAYYQTMSDRDWETYRTFFWDKATLTTTWQAPGEYVESVTVTTIDEFIATTGEGPDSQPIFEEKMTGSNVTVKNNLATAWVHFKAKFGTEDNLIEWEGTDLFSLMQHNGEWRIVALVFSSEEL